MTIGKSDVYTIYKDLVIHSETISWNRFGNFLVISSILVLAWVTLFAIKDNLIWRAIVMTGISTIGVITGLIWADLGARGREYLDQYKAKAVEIETNHGKENWWDNGIEEKDRPYQIDIKPKWYSKSKTLLVWVPRLFSFLHVLLLLATWM